jgi:hypothetical protein
MLEQLQMLERRLHVVLRFRSGHFLLQLCLLIWIDLACATISKAAHSIGHAGCVAQGIGLLYGHLFRKDHATCQQLLLLG